MLFAAAPFFIACAIFLDVLRERRRVTTKADREAVAGSAREIRRLVGVPLMCLAIVLVAPLTVGALHLVVDREAAWLPGGAR